MKLLVAVPVLLLSYMWDCSGHEPPAPQYEFVVVRHQQVVDQQLGRPRTRWIVELASKDSIFGLTPRRYVQLKTFDLSDTVTFKPGQAFEAYYHPKTYVDAATPWQTVEEWLAPAGQPRGYTLHPEVTLNEVHVP
jgi:hypothetical protein